MVFTRQLASLCLLALFVAGCGGDSSSGTADKTTSAGGGPSGALTSKRKARLAAADQANPRLVGPATVSVGERLHLSGRDFLPGMKVTIGFIPKAFINDTGTGIDIHGAIHVSPKGTFETDVRFPGAYCTGAPRCIKKPFTHGMQVVVGASGSPGLGGRYIATVG